MQPLNLLAVFDRRFTIATISGCLYDNLYVIQDTIRASSELSSLRAGGPSPDIRGQTGKPG